jgi:gluconolactonase
MTRLIAAFACLAALFSCGATAHAQSKKIDLRTTAGTDAVRGQWRYHDVRIIEVTGKNKDGSPNKTYNYEPKAKGPDFDDNGWEVIAPETLRNARSTGQICFCWYRIKVTLPPDAEGKSVFFQTTVDDYGEVWVDGKLPRKPGDTGGPIVAGFNYPNRVELKDPKPGKTYQIAIFGINGPISDTPTNWIFLGPTFLEMADRK